jgi:hypothetical protein
MPHNEKTRSKSPATAKSTRLMSAKRKPAAYAYALTESTAKKIVVERLPSGVVVALLTTGPAAEKRLKAWAPMPIERTGRIVVRGLGGHAKPQDRIEASAYAPSSRARALLQGMKIATADLKEAGGAFNLEQVQTILNGVSRQAVEKRVKDGSLLAVPGPNNRRRYPTIQFTREGVVPGLRDVQEALPTRNSWAVLNFLVRPDDRLGGRKPIEVLRNGDVDLVVSAARGMGEQGG